jgi:uncharacterized protein
LIRVIGAAQWEDGYLFTLLLAARAAAGPTLDQHPWIHEQYCVGHMYEAAVAHYEVTGDDVRS